MVYYLDEKPGESWAENVLQLLGYCYFSSLVAYMYECNPLFIRYNRNPRHLQSVMKRVFELATSQINIPGTTVVPIPLYDALDGAIYLNITTLIIH